MHADVVRVLIVDDEPGFRNVMARMLERLGFSTLVAEDGVQGLELVKRENPSLVVLDQRMPAASWARGSSRATTSPTRHRRSISSLRPIGLLAQKRDAGLTR